MHKSSIKIALSHTRLRLLRGVSTLVWIVLFINYGFGQKSESKSALYFSSFEGHDSIFFDTINSYQIENTFSYPDSVIAVSDIHFIRAKKAKNSVEVIKALDNKALAHCVKGEYDLALVEMQKVVEQALNTNNQEILAKKYNNIGSIYYYKEQYVEAIRYYNLSLPYFKETDQKGIQADIINNIGLIYYEINSHKKALEYFEEALALYENFENYEDDGMIWLNLGSTKLRLDQPHEAITYFKKAKPIFVQQKNMLSLADCHFMFAKAYQSIGLEQEAIANAYDALHINQDLGNPTNVITAKTLIASILLKNDPVAALKIGEEILPSCKSINDHSVKTDLYELLYKCYKIYGQSSKALEMHEQFKMYNDSLIMEEDETAIVKETILNEYNERLHQQELVHIASQNELKLKQTRRSFLMIIISLLSIALILYLAKSRIRNHKEEQSKLLSQLEELKKQYNKPTNLKSGMIELDKTKIEQVAGRSINETDWTVMNILLEDPVISNKEIAQKAFMSVDGIGSSLRRMYKYFSIKESRYMKISLIMELIKISS